MNRTARTYFDAAGKFVGVVIVFTPDEAAGEALGEDGISIVRANGTVFRQHDPHAGGDLTAVEGVYTAQHRLENGAPALGPPPPRPIAKRTILERLHAAGKLVAADAALNGGGDSAALLRAEKWYAAATIMSDDEEAIAFLAAIGADPAAILAPE